MSNKKICILTTVHSASDARIFKKEALSLKRSGYEVVLIAPQTKDEVKEGVRILAFSEPKNRFYRIFVSTFNALSIALGQKAGIYHIHDPELVSIGILLKILGKRVIYDVHEDVPAQILTKRWLGSKKMQKFISASFNTYERFLSKFFDRIIVATPHIAKRFPDKKTTIIGNFPVLELIDNSRPLQQKKDKQIVIYAGALTEIRGIREAVKSAEYIKENAELWLLGRWQDEIFEKECNSLAGWKYTKYLGILPIDEMYRLMFQADIGISLFHPVKNHITSLPTKIFEYMACSLPMVLSDFSYWQELFSECAVFVDSYNPEDIADKILYLLNNVEKMKEMGEKGRQLVREKYSWSSENKKLINIYNTMSSPLKD